MSNRMLVVFAIAALIAAGAALGVRKWMSPDPIVTQAPVQTGKILVAKRDLPAGTFINAATDLDWAPWPAENVREFHLREGSINVNEYQGAVVRRMIHAADPLVEGALVKRGAGGFMPAVLEPGMRAVSIGVSVTSGNAGFVSPGDYVDLILTHRLRLSDSAGDANDSVISETFVENVRVIAVDQQLDNPDNKAILAKTITVEVTPQQAEKVTVAQDLGKISVALRSLAIDSQNEAIAKEHDAAAKEKVPAQATVVDPFFMEEVQVPATEKTITSDRDTSEALSERSEVSPRVKVIRGDKVETLRFYRSHP